MYIMDLPYHVLLVNFGANLNSNHVIYDNLL